MNGQIDLYQQDDGVAILTFNRPDALNALSLEMMRQFAEVVDELQFDDSLRVVIVTGAGEDAFCSGGDLQELSRFPKEEDALSFITLMGDALRALEQLPVPVIAAINGYALGGGSEIAVACDLRFVDERARIGFVHARLALTPGWGAGQRLLRLVGYPTAMHLLLTGQILLADDIERLRLATQIVPQGQALDAALAFAREVILPAPLDVVRAIKTLLRAGLKYSPDVALRLERDLFPPLWAAEPHLDAMEQFLKNRKDGA